MGAGLGTGQRGSRRFQRNAVVETEFARVVHEVGVVGLVGFLLTYLGAVCHLYRLHRHAGNRLMSSLALGCTILCFGLLYGGVAFNHISSVVFWGAFAVTCVANDSALVDMHHEPMRTVESSHCLGQEPGKPQGGIL